MVAFGEDVHLGLQHRDLVARRFVDDLPCSRGGMHAQKNMSAARRFARSFVGPRTLMATFSPVFLLVPSFTFEKWPVPKVCPTSYSWVISVGKAESMTADISGGRAPNGSLFCGYTFFALRIPPVTASSRPSSPSHTKSVSDELSRCQARKARTKHVISAKARAGPALPPTAARLVDKGLSIVHSKSHGSCGVTLVRRTLGEQ